MQLGFEAYLDLVYEDQARFRRLMAINQAFATAWGKAQLAAGATGLVYADPLASPSMVPVERYRETGLGVARETLAAFPVPPFIHLASGRTLDVLDLLAGTGTPGIGVSCEEDLAEVKRRCAGRLAVIGNLNGIAMASWSQDQTALEVKRALAKGGPGGGFILSDTHGELPWGVSEETLGTIAETVRTWGTYPLRGEGHG
jgi:uroporphyrinogen decarboxylase